MHRIDTSTAQKDKFGAGKNGFTSGNAQTGVPATEVSPDILDAMQEEICSVIESEGLTLDKSKRDQLLAAINKKISNVPSATIEKKGVVRLATDEEASLGQSIEVVMSAKNVADAVKNMLKQMFVGVPLAWTSATPPTWAVNMVGQAINPTTDPILASRYPSGIVPDHRAMTVRGWDNGRGIDTGRVLLSQQEDAIRNLIGSHNYGPVDSTDPATGVFGSSDAGFVGWLPPTSTSNNRMVRNRTFDASRVVPTAPENRIKSLAYNIITMRG
ncbi:integrase [Aeromonas jandaei]|uniref:integrase n=1 Tax=Aeromonas jandaei TaxID=650 RepID=UPI000F53AFE2|nr:integrase [Aeromonas jandaei]RQM76233.1 integrase [Aeromonas jandaei]